jgi:hypothetical protein
VLRNLLSRIFLILAIGSTINLIATTIRFPSFEQAICSLVLWLIFVSLAIAFVPSI